MELKGPLCMCYSNGAHNSTVHKTCFVFRKSFNYCALWIEIPGYLLLFTLMSVPVISAVKGHEEHVNDTFLTLVSLVFTSKSTKQNESQVAE